MLLRVLPSVYPRQPDTIHSHLGNLTGMMSQLESPEQQHLIRLIQMVAEQHPLVSVYISVSLTVGYTARTGLCVCVCVLSAKTNERKFCLYLWLFHISISIILWSGTVKVQETLRLCKPWNGSNLVIGIVIPFSASVCGLGFFTLVFGFSHGFPFRCIPS